MAEGQLLGVTRLAFGSRPRPGWVGGWGPVSSPPAPVFFLEEGKDNCHPECLRHQADFHPIRRRVCLSASSLRLLRARSQTRDSPSLGCQGPAALWDTGAPLHRQSVCVESFLWPGFTVEPGSWSLLHSHAFFLFLIHAALTGPYSEPRSPVSCGEAQLPRPWEVGSAREALGHSRAAQSDGTGLEARLLCSTLTKAPKMGDFKNKADVNLQGEWAKSGFPALEPLTHSETKKGLREDLVEGGVPEHRTRPFGTLSAHP